MLSRQQLRPTFAYFWVSSKFLGILPLRIDGNGNIVSLVKPSFAHLFWVIVASVHTLFLGVRLLEYAGPEGKGKIRFLPLHSICFFAGAAAVLWSVRLFIYHGELSAKLFNDTINRLPHAGKILKLQDPLPLTLPLSCLNTSVCFLLSIPFSTGSPQFVYFLLKDSCICYAALGLMLDYSMYIFMCTTFSFGLCTQLLFFQSMEVELDQQIRKLRDGDGWLDVPSHFATLHPLSFRITMFNRVFPLLIFAFKLIAASNSIMGLFFALKLLHSNVLLSLGNCWMGLLSCATYILVYYRCHKVAGKMDEYKTLFKTSSAQQRGQNSELNRILRSFPKGNVKVGSFYAMERSSSLVFMGFCISAVCNLIVSFPQDL